MRTSAQLAVRLRAGDLNERLRAKEQREFGGPALTTLGELLCLSDSEAEPTPSGGRRWYLGYGSNMNEARMRERGALFTQRVACTLRDARLEFNKTGGCGQTSALCDSDTCLQHTRIVPHWRGCHACLIGA